MSKYIEIVFDDSGSMTSYLKNKPKHIVAKEMFINNVAPYIGDQNDFFAIRLLRDNCSSPSNSRTIKYDEIERELLSITRFNKSTPLYYTIKDSIETCKSKQNEFDEFKIFVLTDGDDTCRNPMESIISSEDLRLIEMINIKSLLVQFAVDDLTTQNNLNVLSKYIKGSTVNISSSNTGKVALRKQMDLALNSSNFIEGSKMPHCFGNDLDSMIMWKQVKDLGLDDFIIEKIKALKLIKWKIDKTKPLKEYQFLELKFLYGLFSNLNLGDSTIIAMLKDLKAPYYYKHECIYWNFFENKWKRLEQPKLISNPKANFEDKLQDDLFDQSILDIIKEFYSPNKTYEVVFGETNMKTFQLRKIEEYSLEKGTLEERVKKLKIGDLIKFIS